jgi:hypothetical protein
MHLLSVFCIHGKWENFFTRLDRVGVENWVAYWSLIAISANCFDQGEVEQASMTLIVFYMVPAVGNPFYAFVL